MGNEWYLCEYREKVYLHNKLLIEKTFDDSVGTHNHCELCWARFSYHPTDLQAGYFEPISKSWICPDCYNELALLFGWRLA
jgi:hypothetical protein